MASDSKADTAIHRPLWVIAFSLGTIAICLMILVIQMQLPDETQPAKVPLFTRERVPTPAPFRPSTSPKPSVARTPARIQQAANPAAEPDAGPVETSLSAFEPADPAPVRKVATASPGGFAPLTWLGQTNYQTAIIGKVVLHGTPTAETPIPLAVDAPCAGPDSGPLTTHFFVVGPKGELADTLVFIKEGSFQQHFSIPRTRHELVFTNCMIEPYVSAIFRGDELMARSAGSEMHILRAEAGNSSPISVTVQPGGTTGLRGLSRPELFVRLRCEVHPWEFAYTSVIEHPFFAVTDESGTFSITNVPPGKYALKAIHRKAQGVNEVTRFITVRAGEVVSADFTIEAAAK